MCYLLLVCFLLCYMLIGLWHGFDMLINLFCYFFKLFLSYIKPKCYCVNLVALLYLNQQICIHHRLKVFVFLHSGFLSGSHRYKHIYISFLLNPKCRPSRYRSCSFFQVGLQVGSTHGTSISFLSRHVGTHIPTSTCTVTLNNFRSVCNQRR